MGGVTLLSAFMAGLSFLRGFGTGETGDVVALSCIALTISNTFSEFCFAISSTLGSAILRCVYKDDTSCKHK